MMIWKNAGMILKDHRNVFINVAAAYLVAGLILGTAVALWIFKDIPIGHFTRDPANTFGYEFYIGSISSIGFILWTATATACLFAAIVLRNNQPTQEELRMSTFLFASGVLTMALLFDDMFLFHELFFPNYLHISDYVTFSTYAAVTLAYLVIFRDVILNSRFLVLGLAGALLGLGMIVDKLMDNSADTSIKFLVEDGIKFFGITTWFVYYLRLTIDQCSDIARR
jgi:hypothetical protein